jgi:hypothetical protein
MVSFERHKENPLDSLGVGRIVERKRKVFDEKVVQTISDINKIIEDYDTVKMVGWDPLYCTNMTVNDPFYGFQIRLKISTFPFPSMEKVYDCNIEYYMETDIVRLRWFLTPGVEEMDKFGNLEECKVAFNSWLSQYCYRKNDQRRYRIRWI